MYSETRRARLLQLVEDIFFFLNGSENTIVSTAIEEHIWKHKLRNKPTAPVLY